MAGGNPALIVRVAATIEELRANLKEGVNQIETTTAAMGKMAASFSGDKLIQHAHNVTAAVNQIGGASKLTDAEAARVNATLERALEKYAALGRDAPAGMQKLADETKRVDTVSGGLTETVKSLAMGFAAMFTARAAFNFVSATIAEAGALKDLSQQTHISVEDLQILAGSMSEFGVDADTLGKGLFTLSRKIAGGDDSVAHGLHQMGLSLEDVRGLNGQELFLTIMDGLSTLQGGLRDDTASEIFGSRLGMAMAGASDGIRGTMATWKELNHVASTESVSAMDQYDESIKRTQRSLSSMAANMIGPVAQGFNTLFDAAIRGASKWDLFLGLLPKGLGLAGTGVEGLATALDRLNTKTDAAAASTHAATAASGAHTASLDTRSQAVRFLDALEADAARKLTATQVQYLERLKAMGALNAQNAAGVGVSGAQYAKYTADVQAATAALHGKGAAIALVEPKLGSLATFIRGVSKETDVFNTGLRFTTETFGDLPALIEPAIGSLDTFIKKQKEAAEPPPKPAAQAPIMTGGMGMAAGRQANGDVIVPGAWAYGESFSFLGTSGSGYSGKRAAGGPVAGGERYLVGERGPEMFVPGSSGSIVPNGGGATTIQIYITQPLGSPEAIGDAITSRMRSLGMRL